MGSDVYEYFRRDALGNETWIHYEDASYPGLPTRVRHPNGWEVTASYHSNGLLDEVVDRSTGGVTSYQWNTTWSQPAKITSPEGVVTEFSYNGSGDRTKRKVGADSVLYAYNGDGQVTKITDGEGNETTLAYDSHGNLESETGPTSIGSWTHYERDGRGYATHMGQATGTASDSTIVTKTFDEVGRVTESLQTTSADAMWLRTTHTYDAATGLKTQTEAWGGATANDSTTTGTTEWEYDPFGRVIVKDLPEGRDSLVYDLAGNVETRFILGGVSPDSVTMVYDALNRLTDRTTYSRTESTSTINGVQFPYYDAEGLSVSGSTVTIDGDDHDFTYDEMGNLLTADNDYAEITRTYFLNGQLKTEQQALRRYDNSTNFTHHVYDLGFAYDLDGRRTALNHPSWLSAGSDRTRYVYDESDGRLSQVTDALGSAYSFTHNHNGQPTKITFPGGSTSEKVMDYDAAGRMDSLLVTVDGVQLFGSELTYDLGGRVLTAAGGSHSSTLTYNGLGHLTQAKLWLGGEESREDFERDAFGSATSQHSWPSFGGPTSGPGTKFNKSYNSNSGGSMNSEIQDWDYPSHSSEPTGWSSLEGWTSFGYDGRGNLRERTQIRYEPEWIGSPDPYDEVRRAATHEHNALSYFTGDELLRVHQITRDSTYHDEASGQDVSGDPWGAYEEYWYDALGRRVLKRSRQGSPLCSYSERCYSSIERYVWDGDQILWELRQSGAGDTKNPSGSAYTGQTGTIGYVHAQELDKPLGMVRNGNTVVLHYGWRGTFETATKADGTQIGTDVPWPGGRWKASGAFLDPRETHTWVGSLPMGQADHSGLQYRRNRYYDPESGQFTQQDPIGIAGGLNLYGYADGDPVNFSDPFGLCPQCAWGAVAGAAVETGVQLFLEDGNLDGSRILTAAFAGGLTGGLSTSANAGRVFKALGTAAVSVLEGRAKTSLTGRQTTLREDLANAAFGSAASGAGELVGSVTDDAARYMARNSRVLPGSPHSTRARAEMTAELTKKFDWAAFKAAWVGGIVGQGGVVIEGLEIE